QVDDPAPCRRVADPQEAGGERPAFERVEEGPDLAFRHLAIGEARCVRRVAEPFEEILYRDGKDIADPVEAPGADPVLSSLVFLDLLKAQPQRPPELFLTDAERDP